MCIHYGVIGVAWIDHEVFLGDYRVNCYCCLFLNYDVLILGGMCSLSSGDFCYMIHSSALVFFIYTSSYESTESVVVL